MSADSIHIIGARQHNLRNIEVVIPRNRLVVNTGMSGSGKSSLAFNTLYAEGQRRYVESLSAYARQFISQMDKPDVDRIEGLSPAIAIAQRSSNPNPRSTTATTTEIYDYLRILYAAVGVPHDPGTGEVLSRSSVEEIVDEILAEPEGTRAVILAPKIRYDGRSFKDTFQFLLKQGFVRARIGGEIVDLESPPALPAKARPEIDLVVDRLAIRADARSRIYESVETALRWSQPRVQVTLQQRGDDSPRTRRFTTTFSNPETGFTMPELTPRHFSFNGHLGACPQCHGLGSELVCDPQLLVPDPSLSIAAGAIKSWWARNKKLKAGQGRQILALADHFGADLEAPFDSLPQAFAEALFHGTGDLAIPTGWKTGPSTRSIEKPYEGLVTQAERLHENSKSEVTRRNVRRFMAARTCERCEGRRLRDEMLAVTLSGKDGAGRSIRDFTALDVAAARRWIATLSFEGTRETVARPLLDEISKRLCFLDEVGLGYLTLDRQSSTLSGGESQRIRLATQLGSALAGVLYVLDEPTIGLHPSDVGKLIATLENLRDLGNSVVVVEHEQEMMRAADLIIDLGPGAGPEGGEVVAIGTAKQLEAHPASLTGAYLSGARRIHPPEKRIRPPALPRRPAGDAKARESLDSGWLTIEGAGEHNLADIDVSLPLGCLVCVTGVSGSGKSTLIDSILRRVLFRHFHGARDIPGA
ncbi:MAG: excinuclease ABC subunit UvrA, partial [Verrucomicrobiales bacterium]